MDLPVDIQQQCLWIVRGYERTRKEYTEARKMILDAESSSFHSSRVQISGFSRATENDAARLAAIDNYPAFLRMFAVEHALDAVTKAFPLELKPKIKKALLLSCQDGREWPFERLDAPGLSRSGFYRMRRRFLLSIAQELKLFYMVEKGT